MDRWHSHILERQARGNNPLMNEKTIQGIKNAVRNYMALYQNPNEQRIEAWAHDLYETNYSPAQIKDALEDIKNTENKLVSVAEVRQVLGLKFGRSRREAEKASADIEKKIKDQLERFENLKRDFIKSANEDAYERYVKKYMSEVFPGVEVSELGIDTWARIALLDFYDADCDFKRAVALGNKRADLEYQKRRRDDYSIIAGYRKENGLDAKTL